MKRFLLSLLAIFFPWIIILISGRPIEAVGNLAMQLTFIGWIPASIWAFKTVNDLCKPEQSPDSSETSEETQVSDAPSTIEKPKVSTKKTINAKKSTSTKKTTKKKQSSTTAPKDKE